MNGKAGESGGIPGKFAEARPGGGENREGRLEGRWREIGMAMTGRLGGS